VILLLVTFCKWQILTRRASLLYRVVQLQQQTLDEDVSGDSQTSNQPVILRQMMISLALELRLVKQATQL